MPTMTPRRPHLADAIIDELAGEILRGALGEGQLLAPEPQLSERFGVSRTVVREAIKRLQSLGLIEVRHGIGTIVLGPDEWDDLDPDLIRIRTNAGLIGDLAEDLFAVRRIIEVEVAGVAAQARSDQDIVALTAIVEAMRAPEMVPAHYTDLDIAFHDALLAAAGNRLLAKMMQPVNEIRRIGSLITTGTIQRVIPDSIVGHERILAAVEAGDADRARAEMADHLDEFARDLAAGLSSAAAVPAR
ncbi:MAG: FadR/GntR family transcriptional regulator [Thermomicrobiales bacterium]